MWCVDLVAVVVDLHKLSLLRAVMPYFWGGLNIATKPTSSTDNDH